MTKGESGHPAAFVVRVTVAFGCRRTRNMISQHMRNMCRFSAPKDGRCFTNVSRRRQAATQDCGECIHSLDYSPVGDCAFPDSGGS